MLHKKYLQLSFIIILSCMIFILTGCNDAMDTTKKITNNVVEKVQSEVTKDNPFVVSVKEGHLSSYPNSAIGQAFKDFFSSPTWKYFEAESGENVVEFTGHCTYAGQEVKAKMQFIVDKNNGSFEIGALSFNDVPQNQLIKIALLEAVYGKNQPDNSSTDSQVENKGTSQESSLQSDSSETEPEEGSPNYVNFSAVSASSELSSSTFSYKVGNVQDWDQSTAWVEGKDGDGIGEWVKLETGETVTITGIEILNGYHKTEELFFANNRAKKVLIEFSDGTKIEKVLTDGYYQNNQVNIGKKVTTQYIKVTILEVYKGSKYSDTCITEIHAY